MKALLLLSCSLATSCVEDANPDPPIDNGWCSVTASPQRFTSEVRVSATCPIGETRSLVLTVKDGEYQLSSSLVRFACGSVNLVTQVATTDPGLVVEAVLIRDDRTRVVCQ